MKTNLVNLILAYSLFCSFHSYSQIEHKENFIYNDSIYTIEIQQVFNGQQGYKISVYNENHVARSFYMAELSYSIFKERLFQTIAEKPASGIDKSEKKQTFFSIIDNYKIIENFHKAEYDLSQAPIAGYFILHPDSIPTFPFLHSSYGYGHFGFHKKSLKKVFYDKYYNVYILLDTLKRKIDTLASMGEKKELPDSLIQFVLKEQELIVENFEKIELPISKIVSIKRVKMRLHNKASFDRISHKLRKRIAKNDTLDTLEFLNPVFFKSYYPINTPKKVLKTQIVNCDKIYNRLITINKEIDETVKYIGEDSSLLDSYTEKNRHYNNSIANFRRKIENLNREINSLEQRYKYREKELETIKFNIEELNKINNDLSFMVVDTNIYRLKINKLKGIDIDTTGIVQHPDSLEIRINQKISSYENDQQKTDSLYNVLKKQIEALNDTIQSFTVIINKYNDSIFINNTSFKRNVEYLRRKLKMPKSAFEMDSIQIEITDGNIKNVMAVGKFDGKFAQFINLRPIPFSSLTDYNFSDHLYSFNHKSNPNNYKYTIPFSDLIRYIPKLYVKGYDYCPENTTFTMGPAKQQVKISYRPKLINILDARIYSDFVGFSDDNPNGIIQTEVSKKVLLNPTKNPVYLNGKLSSFFGALGYIDINLVVNKIEESNKYLPLLSTENLIGNSGDTLFTYSNVNSKFQSHIDIYRYQNINLNSKINFISIDFPKHKAALNFDGGISIGNVPLQDSTYTYSRNAQGETISFSGSSSRYSINAFSFFTDMIVSFFPDHRYGLDFGVRWSKFFVHSDNIAQTSFTKNYSPSNNKGDLLSVKLDAFINLSDSDKFFFRGRYNADIENWYSNFLEIQFGYAFSIFKRQEFNGQ